MTEATPDQFVAAPAPVAIVASGVYTTAEAAALLRLSSRTLRTLADSQKIKHQRAGLGKTAPYRFSGQALLDFLNPPAIDPPPANPRGRPPARRRATKRPGINA
jgi:excisionase family DNA binding protein